MDLTFVLGCVTYNGDTPWTGCTGGATMAQGWPGGGQVPQPHRQPGTNAI